jgi:hypothetical protein
LIIQSDAVNYRNMGLSVFNITSSVYTRYDAIVDSLSYDFAVRLGQDDMPDMGWPPHIGRKGTDRNRTGRLRIGLE